MNSQKAAILVNTLVRRTDERRIDWTATSDPRAFETSFSNRTLRIVEGWDDESKNHYYHLELLNETADTIDTIYSYEIRKYIPNAREVLATLYSLARDQALALDEAVDQMLEEMGGPVPLHGDDEIPF